MARKTPGKKTDTTPQKGRPANSEVAPGVFPRGKTFWLRYSLAGEQIRVSLHTKDPELAVKRANEMRGRPVASKKTGQIRGGKTELERALDRYIAAGGIKGKLGDLAKKNARQAVTHFATFTETADPAGITTAKLKEYYEKLNGTWIDPKAKRKKNEPPKQVTTWKKSEATAQTYASRVAAFARWAGYHVATPHFPPAPAREVVISAFKVEELLETAKGDLKFVLLAGFRAGMRRREISWARPSWFVINSEKPHIRIPCPDRVTGWMPKSKRSRSIPLTSDFIAHIRETYPDWETRAFCIRPEKKPGKWIYRFDDRKLFKAFTKKECPELTHHTMRHTYASILANGGIGIAQLAAWTGDLISTLEKHYLHLSADAEKAEEAFTAHRNPTPRQVQAALAAQVKWLQEMLAAQATQNGTFMEHEDLGSSNVNEPALELSQLKRRKLDDY
jgi:integrase